MPVKSKRTPVRKQRRVRNPEVRKGEKSNRVNENTALEPKLAVKEKNRFFREKSSGNSQKFQEKAWIQGYIRRSRPVQSNSVQNVSLDVPRPLPDSTLRRTPRRKGPYLLGTIESFFREDIAQEKRDLLVKVKERCMGGRTASYTNRKTEGPFRNY